MSKTFSIVPASAPAAPPARAAPSSASTPTAASSQPAPPVLSADPLGRLPRPLRAAAAGPAADSTRYATSDDRAHAEPSTDAEEMDIAESASRRAAATTVGTQPTEADMPSVERPRKRPRSSTDSRGGASTAPATPATESAALPAPTKARHPATVASALATKRTREVPLPVRPLIQVSERIYFAMFDGSVPSSALLSAHGGTHCAIFPRLAPMSAGVNAPKPQRLPFAPARSRGKNPDLVWAPSAIQSQFTWFTVDRKIKGKHESDTVPSEFAHTPFFDDWGPLNMALVYQFCLLLNDYLTRPSLEDHGIVFYTSTRPHVKANAVALLALRMVLVEGKTPSEALHPFATLELEPFRDAGYGKADYALSLQDVVYGAWRAATQNLFDIETFDRTEYLYSERTVNNDWSWIIPNVIAFASPDDPRFRKGIQQGLVEPKDEEDGDLGFPQDYLQLLPDTEDEQRSFAKWDEMRGRLLSDFGARNVKLVVRLNDALYDRALFTDVGIDHLDLYFEDGSNPSDQILRTFLHRIRATIHEGGAVAVHCKAGLGRTGVLISSYLIYQYGFDANEAIAWMRLMRPGCVVGPQQHFLRNKTRTLVCWAERDRSKEAELLLRKERKSLLEEIKVLRTANANRAHTQSAGQHRDSPRRKSVRSTRVPFSPRSKSATVDGEDKVPAPGAGGPAQTHSSAPSVAEIVDARGPVSSLVRSPSVKAVRAHDLPRSHGPLAPVISPENLPTPVVGQPRKPQCLPGEASLLPEAVSASGSSSKPGLATANASVPLTQTPGASPKIKMPAPGGGDKDAGVDLHSVSLHGRLAPRADEVWTTHPRARVKTADKDRLPSTPARRPTSLTPPARPPSLTPPVLTSSQFL